MLFPRVGQQFCSAALRFVADAGVCPTQVQEVIEEGLAAIRDDLGKMERDVEQLNALLFEADLFLATPGTALQHGLNPREALTHVSSLFSNYQAELIRLRCVDCSFAGL